MNYQDFQYLKRRNEQSKKSSEEQEKVKMGEYRAKQLMELIKSEKSEQLRKLSKLKSAQGIKININDTSLPDQIKILKSFLRESGIDPERLIKKHRSDELHNKSIFWLTKIIKESIRANIDYQQFKRTSESNYSLIGLLEKNELSHFLNIIEEWKTVLYSDVSDKKRTFGLHYKNKNIKSF